MSVYSGFATRQQQSKYNSLLQNLILALKKRIIKFYRQQPADQDKFKLLIKKIYKKMFVLERGKFMIPKYSTCFGDLVAQLGIEIDYDNMSDSSSIASGSFTVVGENGGGGEFLRSRSILQSKKNSIELALKRDRGSIQSFSLGKHHNFEDFENREETQSRGSSLDHAMRSKALARMRLKEMKDLGQLRGTSNFPKYEDFMPKAEEMPKQMLFQSPQKKPQTREVKEKDHRSFRRHKFSRSDVQVEQL